MDIELQIEDLTRQIETGAADDAALGRLHVERGRLLWRMGRLAEAITDYNVAAGLDSDGPGAELAAHSSGIMDFYNPDIYNP